MAQCKPGGRDKQLQNPRPRQQLGSGTGIQQRAQGDGDRNRSIGRVIHHDEKWGNAITVAPDRPTEWHGPSVLADTTTGNKEEIATALLGPNWKAHLADSDAFAGIAKMYSEAAGDLALEVECCQLSGGKSSRLDADTMLEGAKHSSTVARRPSLTFTPGKQ